MYFMKFLNMDSIKFLMLVWGMIRFCNFEIEGALCMAPHTLTYVGFELMLRGRLWWRELRVVGLLFIYRGLSL